MLLALEGVRRLKLNCTAKFKPYVGVWSEVMRHDQEPKAQGGGRVEDDFQRAGLGRKGAGLSPQPPFFF